MGLVNGSIRPPLPEPVISLMTSVMSSTPESVYNVPNALTSVRFVARDCGDGAYSA